jgi:carbonic anhydrase
MESIGRAVRPDDCLLPADAPADRRSEIADEVAARNVARVVAEVRRRSQVIEELVLQGEVGIVGMLYDVTSGTALVVPDTAAGFPEGTVQIEDSRFEDVAIRGR